MRKELERRGLEHVFQHSVRSGFVLDFAFPDKNLGVECDGSRWHPKGKKRDRFRDRILNRGGWTILRFRDDEIIYRVSDCVDKIEQFL
jgi:very-short-patch-repair endonuclease